MEGDCVKIYQGKSVFSGVAMGPVFVYKRAEKLLEKYNITDPEAEIARYDAAKAKADEQLKHLVEKTRRELGKEEARIFEAHRLLLEDMDFVEGIVALIRQDKVNAEYAVFVSCEQCAAVFMSMDDGYMRERAADIQDISRRLISILNGSQIVPEAMPEPVIVVAEDLAPSETVQFEKDKILALVTKKGSVNSHAAILARMMQVPCVVAAEVDWAYIEAGQLAVVDGEAGLLYVNPDDETVSRMGKKARKELEKKQGLSQLIGLKTETKSGRSVNLFANIAGPEDLEEVLNSDAEGIGMFRSEFLYLGREEAPSEEEQYQIYKTVLEKMQGKKVIIRTMDVGADKQAPYLKIPREENPALGVRGIRYSLWNPELFQIQLRAILRAAAHGNAAVMFPMVTSAEEVRKAKALLEEAKKELQSQGIAYGNAELGIMIETPAAALTADSLAEEVDFFSIGTNDLTQYALAMDRQSQAQAESYNVYHEAVMRMIEYTAACAHKAGIWCGICGELAADVSLTKYFVELGVDELSVSPAFVLGIRRRIRELD